MKTTIPIAIAAFLTISGITAYLLAGRIPVQSPSPVTKAPSSQPATQATKTGRRLSIAHIATASAPSTNNALRATHSPVNTSRAFATAPPDLSPATPNPAQLARPSSEQTPDRLQHSNPPRVVSPSPFGPATGKRPTSGRAHAPATKTTFQNTATQADPHTTPTSIPESDPPTTAHPGIIAFTGTTARTPKNASNFQAQPDASFAAPVQTTVPDAPSRAKRPPAPRPFTPEQELLRAQIGWQAFADMNHEAATAQPAPRIQTQRIPVSE